MPGPPRGLSCSSRSAALLRAYPDRVVELASHAPGLSPSRWPPAFAMPPSRWSSPAAPGGPFARRVRCTVSVDADGPALTIEAERVGAGYGPPR